MAQPRWEHTATNVGDGAVLVAGGYDGENGLSSAELWDPGTGRFHPTGSLAEARSGHVASPLPDGWVLVSGGTLGEERLASAEVWGPAGAATDPEDTGEFVVISPDDPSWPALTVIADAEILRVHQ